MLCGNVWKTTDTDRETQPLASPLHSAFPMTVRAKEWLLHHMLKYGKDDLKWEERSGVAFAPL